jgi:cytochrome c biogenesis protein CcmG/thiol:disulfide interchange protein DsbE
VSPRRITALALALVAVGIVATKFLGAAGARTQAMREEACGALRPQQLPAHLRGGAEAPDFELTDANGKKWSLRELRGRPVLINFWATWCAPCVEEMPTLETLNQHAGDLVVLTVSVDESWEPVKKFFGAKGTKLAVLLDSEKVAAKKYGSEKFPETFLIDREGKVQKFFWQARWDSAEAALCLDTLRR